MTIDTMTLKRAHLVLVGEIRDLKAKNAELRAALKPFGTGVMGDIIWRNMPDTATANITAQLGDLRRAFALTSEDFE